MRAQGEDVRRYIDRGLARFGRGELRGAIAAWEEALRLDPENREAQELIAFARVRLPPGNEAEAAVREWDASEDTNPEAPAQTEQRVQEAEAEAVRVVRRPTMESPIPSLLASMTAPDWEARVEREEGAPEMPMPYEDTRRVGSDAHQMAPRAEPPVAAAPAELRTHLSELIERCQAELERGEFQAAAYAAELASREGERLQDPQMIQRARPVLERAFELYVGRPHRVPLVVLGPDAIANQDLDHRAGFLLSRMDGVMDLDQVLEVAGMPRAEAIRVVASLLRVRAIRLL
jgi:tetratricopeptide (TPR) repeat protein